MANYEEKEVRVLEKISNEFSKLDATLEKWENSENKLSAFLEQEKAIHEVRSIIRKAKKIDRIEAAAEDDALYDFAEATQDEIDLLDEIDNRFAKLDDALEKLDDTDSKVKSFVEQEKALHEAKEIVKKMNRL